VTANAALAMCVLSFVLGSCLTARHYRARLKWWIEHAEAMRERHAAWRSRYYNDLGGKE
jgi:hypothetical protein